MNYADEYKKYEKMKRGETKSSSDSSLLSPPGPPPFDPPPIENNYNQSVDNNKMGDALLLGVNLYNFIEYSSVAIMGFVSFIMVFVLGASLGGFEGFVMAVLISSICFGAGMFVGGLIRMFFLPGFTIATVLFILVALGLI